MEHYGRTLKSRFGVEQSLGCDGKLHRDILKKGDNIGTYSEIVFRGPKYQCAEYIRTKSE